MQSLTLEFASSNGCHTGRDIAKLFYGFLQESQLQKKVQGITLDNASSNTIFINELGSFMDQNGIVFNTDDQHFRCMAHIENIGAQNFLLELKLQNEDGIEENTDSDSEEEIVIISQRINQCPIAKLKELFIKIKYSEQLRLKLDCCCISTNTKALAPTIDLKTRWYSTHDMIRKRKKLRKALDLLCMSNLDMQKYSLSEDDWVLLSGAYKHLKLFKSFSKTLSGEKYISLPLVIIGFKFIA